MLEISQRVNPATNNIKNRFRGSRSNAQDRTWEKRGKDQCFLLKKTGGIGKRLGGVGRGEGNADLEIQRKGSRRGETETQGGGRRVDT